MNREVPQILHERDLKVRDHILLPAFKLLRDGIVAPGHNAAYVVD